MSDYDYDGDDYYSQNNNDYSRHKRESRPRSSRQDRDRSPDYHFAGGSVGPYASGAMPSTNRARLEYEPQTPFYPPPPNNLQVPQSPHRPRSVPPLASNSLAPPRDRDRARSRSRDRGRDYDDEVDEHNRSHTPLSKAKHVLHHTFTDSTSGLGVGVLGAIVGGLAAREASEAAARARANNHGGHHRRSEDHPGTLISTIVGAAVGGLGANALEKRIEMSRQKNRDKQDGWDRKSERDGGGGRNRDRGLDDDYSDDGKDRDREERLARDRRRDRDLEGGKPRRTGGAADDYYFGSDDETVYDNRGPHRRGR